MAIKVNNTRSEKAVNGGGSGGGDGQQMMKLRRVTGAAPRRRVVMVLQGPPKSGKTDLAYSGPEPVLSMDLEGGAEGVVENFPNKDIVIPEFPALEIFPDDSVDTVAEKANNLWVPFANDLLYHIRSQKFGTIVVDTGTDVWWLLRMAKFGQLEEIPSNKYGPLNAEMQTFFSAAMAGTKTSVVFIHRMKEEYKPTISKSGKTISSPSGKMKLDGWNQSAYKAQVVIETRRERAEQGVAFFAEVKDSRFNPQIIGMELECGPDRSTFGLLGSMLINGTTPEDWV